MAPKEDLLFYNSEPTISLSFFRKFIEAKSPENVETVPRYLENMYHQVRALQRMILQTTAVVEEKKETAHLKTRPTLKVVRERTF